MLMALHPLMLCKHYNTFTFQTLETITLKTRNNIPEDSNHKQLGYENLKFRIWLAYSIVQSPNHSGDIQGVTGGMCKTSGECSLGQTIPI
jgi:hypothetical protein